jgi:uncharacterized protein
MKRIYIFPRYSGNENSDWYQMACTEIVLRNNQLCVIPLNLPNWDRPETSEFLSFIEDKVPLNELDYDTFFVGHSIGCRAALLFLNELQKKKPFLRIGGLMCIAGWWTVDHPWPQLEQWIDITFNYESIQEVCNRNIICLISDNDPFTTDNILNKSMWEDRLNARVITIPNARHFNNEGLAPIIDELIVLVGN